MKKPGFFQISLIWSCLFCASSVSTAAGREAFGPANGAGLQGGLIVQLGASDTQSAARLSRTGRYLIHVLDPDADKIEAARARLRKDGFYGLAWAEQARNSERLPYAENLVNVISVLDYSVPVEELLRVLAPGGTVIGTSSGPLDASVLQAAGFRPVNDAQGILVARKPWPKEMDEWSHPRHAADGNAVSQDTLVGPPDRVRWIAAATSEVEGMVTAGGRNFYGGILARDSFNGLRLWHRDLGKDDTLNTESFSLPRLSRDGARPVASRRFVFAVRQNRPVALDAATGEVAMQFGDVAKPTALIFDGQRVIVADDKTVRGFAITSGTVKKGNAVFAVEVAKEIWNVAASAPQNVIADGKLVAMIQGRSRRGEKPEVVVLDAASGDVMWQRQDDPWLARAVRTVLAGEQLVFEVSTLNDNDAGNGIHVVEAATGKHLWSKDYPPGMNHARQARAMFLNNDLWILHGGKVNTADKAKLKRLPVQVSALDPLTGKVRVTHSAGLTHCFPPVCTPNFMFAGELDMTNLVTGDVIANRITKANCSRENGWVPANGLVYTTPKHCTCWPMLRGFVAMAPAVKDSPENLPPEKMEFILENGPARPDLDAANPAEDDWPQYRHDRWRSGSATTAGPKALGERWRIALDIDTNHVAEPTGPILHDWRDNPVVKGPLSAPTIAGGMAYVTRPNAHELIAIDTASGKVRWRYTASGRLDTPPAIYRGLCLLGSAAGWVTALRADTGELVWRLRAAPTDERIVAYGQVESPWPVPGAVLVMDDVAYFAAGRQPLADGGILVFAVDPLTGKRHWVQRIDSVPQKGFYENSGLEFDPFDILHQDGDGIAMSRWILSRNGKEISVDKWNAFAKLNTGAGEVWIPRGSWTYGARHQHRFAGEAPLRPLVVFRDDNVYSSLNGTTAIFRRDFDLDKGEKFDSKWITGWAAAGLARKNGKPYRTYRIAEKARWAVDPFADPNKKKEEPKYGTQLHNRIHAMALAKDRLYVIHQDGRLEAMSTADGSVIDSTHVPTPAWDGLAIAEGRVFLTTQTGELVCLGE